MEPYGIAPPGFRLPEATHVGSVRLLVTDLDRSLTYYQQVIGLEARTRTTERATLTARQGSSDLVILETRPGLVPARRGAFGLYHFAILLPDRLALGRFVGHLSELGVRFGMSDHRVSEALYLTDPDGLGIEVYADRPRPEWVARGGELVITVEPLDLANLKAAGQGGRWDGAPAETTIGHMHLHVGDLKEGEAFYHGGLGLDKMVWSYQGALFLAAGGYHHHLGTNIWAPGPSAHQNEARLLDWELVVPSREAASRAAQSLDAAGYGVVAGPDGWRAADPWGTEVRVVARENQDEAD